MFYYMYLFVLAVIILETQFTFIFIKIIIWLISIGMPSILQINENTYDIGSV